MTANIQYVHMSMYMYVPINFIVPLYMYMFKFMNNTHIHVNIHTADFDVNTELDMLRMENQQLKMENLELKSQLQPALIHSSGETLPLLTGMLSLILCVLSCNASLGDEMVRYCTWLTHLQDFVVLRCVGRQQW